MTFTSDDDAEGLSRFKIHARREIVNLLRRVSQRNQLVSLQANQGADSVVTSILEVDEASGTVIIDCAPSALTNDRVLASSNLSFETMLDNIRLLFSAPKLESCVYEGRPALCFPIPASVIRVQRREFYRIVTPVTTPVLCKIPLVDEAGNVVGTAVLPLVNVSAGGICVTDEKKLIPKDFGKHHKNCRIELPGNPVTVTLRLRNAQELTLSNGKEIHRLGFMIVDLSNATEAAIQRYITKIEREQNARKAGIG